VVGLLYRTHTTRQQPKKKRKKKKAREEAGADCRGRMGNRMTLAEQLKENKRYINRIQR